MIEDLKKLLPSKKGYSGERQWYDLAVQDAQDSLPLLVEYIYADLREKVGRIEVKASEDISPDIVSFFDEIVTETKKVTLELLTPNK